MKADHRIKDLWDRYDLPEYKRTHCLLVARVAEFLADRITKHDLRVKVDKKILLAAALLHDIDKNIPKLPGEKHPDAGVRVLKEEGMDNVAGLVASHPLHLIINPETAPKTWEEKILFLSDKMVKTAVISVDERFKLWRSEDMDQSARDILALSYPRVKDLEAEIRSAGIDPVQLALLGQML